MYTEYCAIHNSSLTLLLLLTATFSTVTFVYYTAFHLTPPGPYMLPILNLVDGYFTIFANFRSLVGEAGERRNFSRRNGTVAASHFLKTKICSLCLHTIFFFTLIPLFVFVTIPIHKNRKPKRPSVASKYLLNSHLC